MALIHHWPTGVLFIFLVNWIPAKGFNISHLLGHGYYQKKLLLLSSRHLNLVLGHLNES